MERESSAGQLVSAMFSVSIHSCFFSFPKTSKTFDCETSRQGKTISVDDSVGQETVYWPVRAGLRFLLPLLPAALTCLCPPLQMETRKRLAKIVLVLVGLFAVCWFPNHVLYLYRSFHYQQLDLSLAHLVVTLLARVLSFSSSCVNPFALYLLSETFRRHFDRCRPSACTLRPSV